VKPLAKPSLVEEAQARAKALPLAVAPHHATEQERCQSLEEKLERKRECIELFERSGLSMAEFVRRWGRKWSTGHGYLDRTEKRYPRPRDVRVARAIVEYVESLGDDSEDHARSA
jgi:hypothetical protein